MVLANLTYAAMHVWHHYRYLGWRLWCTLVVSAYAYVQAYCPCVCIHEQNKRKGSTGPMYVRASLMCVRN